VVNIDTMLLILSPEPMPWEEITAAPADDVAVAVEAAVDVVEATEELMGCLGCAAVEILSADSLGT
jgi:hypothetical protein